MKQKDRETINLNVQRRILDFLNMAQRPEDILEQIDVEHERAREILAHRDQFGPFGVRNLDQVGEILVDPDLLDRLIDLLGRRRYGEWNILYDTPEEPPVHAALLHTGKVLFIPHGHFAHMPDTFLWDPAEDDAEDAFSFPSNQPDGNLYCSGHSFLSDGSLLVVGGGGASPDDVDRAWKFDPTGGGNGTWNKTAGDMSYARWYPTVITLGGRRVLVIGGSPNHGKVEVYDEYSDSFSTVTMPSERTFPQTYPGLHLLPGGEIFYTRTGFGSAGPSVDPGDPVPGTPYFRLTGSTSGEWVDITDTMSTPNRVKGMSAQILLGPIAGTYIKKVIVVGGNGASTAETVNLSGVSPSWEPETVVPGGGRSNVNVVLLPDGTVFACGGASTTNTAVLPCALYDPLSDSWSEMDSLHYRRAYHSVALLLPSGQVMVTGDVNRTIEIFNPPYMYRGSRPEIADAPELVHHGDTFEVESPQAETIDRVVLVRPMAVTHQTDTEQRVVAMTFNRSGDTLYVTAPDGNHPHPIAPRGYYMLFIVDDDGVPSEGGFIYLH